MTRLDNNGFQYLCRSSLYDKFDIEECFCTDCGSPLNNFNYEDERDDFPWYRLILIGAGIIIIGSIIAGKKKVAPPYQTHQDTLRTAQIQANMIPISEESLPSETNVNHGGDSLLLQQRYCSWCGELLLAFDGETQFCTFCGQKL